MDANDTFLRMTGYTREDLRAGRMNWMHMTPPEYLARTQQAHQELATQQSMTPYEKEYVCKDGSRLPVFVGGVTLPASSVPRRSSLCWIIRPARNWSNARMTLSAWPAMNSGTRSPR